MNNPMPTFDDLDDSILERIETIDTWLNFHQRALLMGVKMGVPSCVRIQDARAAMIAADFTPESVAALEDAISVFNSPFGYIKRKDDSQ